MLFRLTSCALLVIVGAPSLVTADIRVVANGRDGRWDREGSGAIRLVEDLSVGVEDGDDRYLIGKPMDIAIDSHGGMFVVDRGYCRVQKYDSSGVFVQSIGRKGEGPGEFFEPTAAAVDAFDNLFVAADGKVSVFDETGKFVESFRLDPPGAYVRSIRIDDSANLFVTSLDIIEQKVIHKYDSEHRLVQSFCDSYAVGKDIDTREEAMYGGGVLDLEPRGKVYYTQMTPYEIRVFTADGEIMLKVTRENDFMSPPHVEYEGGNISYMSGVSGSSAIITLKDGKFLNVVKILEPSPSEPRTIIDLFDTDGQLLASLRETRDIDLKRADELGYLYAFDRSEFPVLVRLRLVVN